MFFFETRCIYFTRNSNRTYGFHTQTIILIILHALINLHISIIWFLLNALEHSFFTRLPILLFEIENNKSLFLVCMILSLKSTLGLNSSTCWDFRHASVNVTIPNIHKFTTLQFFEALKIPILTIFSTILTHILYQPTDLAVFWLLFAVFIFMLNCFLF